MEVLLLPAVFVACSKPNIPRRALLQRHLKLATEFTPLSRSRQHYEHQTQYSTHPSPQPLSKLPIYNSTIRNYSYFTSLQLLQSTPSSTPQRAPGITPWATIHKKDDDALVPCTHILMHNNTDSTKEISLASMLLLALAQLIAFCLSPISL